MYQICIYQYNMYIYMYINIYMYVYLNILVSNIYICMYIYQYINIKYMYISNLNIDQYLNIICIDNNNSIYNIYR